MLPLPHKQAKVGSTPAPATIFYLYTHFVSGVLSGGDLMIAFEDFKFILVFLLLVALMYISCEPGAINKLNKKGKKDEGSNDDVRNNSRAMM